jgi:hypothetical protein
MLKINDQTVANDCILAKGILPKAIGLMFKKKVEKPLIFMFNRKQFVPLHMFFVFTPIDVLYLDSEKNIVEIKENLQPFKMYNPKSTARFVIELPPNTISKFDIKVNQIASFQEH